MRPTKQASTFRVLISGLLFCSLLCSMTVTPGFASRASKRKQLKQRRVSVQRKISHMQAQLHQVKVQEKQTRQQLSSVEHSVRDVRNKLHAVTLRLQQAQRDLRLANDNLSDARQAFADTREDVSKRLVASYERGTEGYLEVLVSADNLADLLERVQIAKYLREQDRASLAELKQRKDEMLQRQVVAQQKTAEVAMWRQQVAIWHQRVVEEQCRVAENLHQVKDTRDEMESQYQELIHESNAITDMLQQMQNTPAGRRRYNQRYVGNLGGLPVRGRITSPFGWRIHPITHTRRLHTGVDIAAPIGTSIGAAGGGEVIYAGWRGGYGNAVMIDHGHGVTTLYGHMSAINVHVGQVVTRHQLIGWVGSTGFSTGPHCHFEKRINGRPVNPL